MNKIFSMIGLANKAGKVVSGEDSVRSAIQHNKVRLLIITKDASANTQKRFKNAAAFYKVETFEYGSKEELGGSIGKAGRTVVGITDINFGDSIRKLINEQQELDNTQGVN